MEKLPFLFPFHHDVAELRDSILEQFNDLNLTKNNNYFSSFLLHSDIDLVVECLTKNFGNFKDIKQSSIKNRCVYNEKTEFKIYNFDLKQKNQYNKYINEKINEWNLKKQNLLVRKTDEEYIQKIESLFNKKTKEPCQSEQENELLVLSTSNKNNQILPQDKKLKKRKIKKQKHKAKVDEDFILEDYDEIDVEDYKDQRLEGDFNYPSIRKLNSKIKKQKKHH